MTEPLRAAGEALPEANAVTIDELIASFGGEMRAVVEALVAANAFLEEELRRTRAVVSFGYSRGWHHRGQEPVQQ